MIQTIAIVLKGLYDAPEFLKLTYSFIDKKNSEFKFRVFSFYNFPFLISSTISGLSNVEVSPKLE
ncbi:MAG: hypothetical protein RL705_931 [Bacteroidota bacterium]|jgi:hypothetical protein